jgi:hypothetical protein
MHLEINEEFPINYNDSVSICCGSSIPMLDGEIESPKCELAYVIYHFIGFMFSAFSIVMLLAIDDYDWNILSYICLMFFGLIADFSILVLHSHVASDRLLLYYRVRYIQIGAVLYHLSWLFSLMGIPVVILTAIYTSYDLLDFIFWMYFISRIIIGTILIAVYHSCQKNFR